MPLLSSLAFRQYVDYRADVATTSDRTLSLARSLAQLIEEELQVRVATLQTLAVSPSLRAGDLVRFRDMADSVAAQQYPGANIVLLREDGQQLVNTLVSPGAPLPVRQNLQALRLVFATGRPVISGFNQDAAGGGLVVAIDVPVKHADGTVAFVLSINPSLDLFANIIRAQHLPTSWLVSVIDGQGTLIAHVPNGDQVIAPATSRDLADPLQTHQEGIIENTSLDSIPVLSAFCHDSRFGWAVMIAVPRAELTGPAVGRAIRIVVLSSGMLGIGLVLALYSARRIARPIESLRRFAIASDSEAGGELPPTGLPEVDEVATSFRIAEVARQRSHDAEMLLRTGIESISQGFAIYDAEDRLVMCNAAYRQLFGAVESIVRVGRRFEDMLRDGLAHGGSVPPPAQADAWIAQRLRDHRQVDQPIEQKLADGRWILVTKKRLSNGWIAGLRVDISGVKATQVALAASERRFQDIAEVSGDWIWETDAQHRFTQLTGEHAELLTNDSASPIGRSCWEISGGTPDTDELWARHKVDLDAHRSFRNFRFSITTRRNGVRSISASGKPVLGEDGSFLGYRGTATDETAIVEAQQRVETTWALLRDAIDSISGGFLITDANDRFVLLNRWLRDYFSDCTEQMQPGVAYETFLRERVRLGYYPTAEGQEEAWIAAVMARHRQPRSQAEVQLRDGRWFLVTEQRMSNGGVAGISAEITAFKAAQQAVADSEALLQQAQYLAQMGCFTANLDSGDHVWSDGLYRILGVSRDGFRATFDNFVERLVHPDDRVMVRAGLETARQSGQLEALDYRIVRPDGNVRYVHREMRTVYDEANKPRRLIGVMQDVTERRRTEDQLRQSQKMEAIGNLTGGMAHDFNNILGVVVGNLDLARRRLSATDDETQELINEALDAGWRGADLTRRLLAFARRQPLRPGPIDVNRLVADTVRILHRLLGEDIEILLHLDEDVWPIIADSAQLEASLANLANNARDAMSKGGQLIITTTNRHLDADYASQHPEVVAGEFVMIEVSDSGVGMSPEIMSRIFEPFFTTKADGKGTGLGLSMVFGFVRQSGGHVNVYSEPGVGTTFRLYLPRAMGAIATGDKRDMGQIAQGRGEVVLVVEDNAGMRATVLRQLRELGYRVLECDRANAAVDILRRERVDVLLTDIVMPGGMDGVELARTARERWPELRIVLTSGFPQARVEADGTVLGKLQLLSKPYHREELAIAIRAALSG